MVPLGSGAEAEVGCRVSWKDGTWGAWEQEEPTHPSLREGRWAQSLRWPELPQRTDG